MADRRKTWLVAMVLTAIAACAGVPRPVQPAQRAIGEVALVGVASVDRGALLEGLGLVRAREHGQPYARSLVTQDRARIEGYYLRRGFLSATVEPEVAQRGARTDVTFRIVEGPRARLARVEVEGVPAVAGLDAAALRRLVPIDDGAVFDHEAYERAQPAVAAAVADAGYPRARVDGVVLADRGDAEVAIRIVVVAGPRARFGAIELVGVPRGLEAAVRARVSIEPGERYSPRALEETRAALYALKRFSRVRVELGQGDDAGEGDELAGVTITVEEAARHELRAGGGVGLDAATVEVRGRGALSVAGWPWPTAAARVDVQPALAITRDDHTVQPRVEAAAALDQLDLVRPRYTGAIEGGYSYLQVEPYTSHGPWLRLAARTPVLDDVFQLAVGWQLGLTSYDELSPALDDGMIERLGLDGTDRTGSFDQSLVVDARGPDKLHVREGGYLELRLEEGTALAGGEHTFLRVMPDLRGYLSAHRVTVATRARAGLLLGDVPATRRFFGGGAGAYRGLPGRRLSPFVTSADGAEVPYGGTALLDVSTELRMPVTASVGLAAFLDGGDVTEGWDEMDLGRLHWASGAGLRFSTPLGVIRGDVAYRMTRAGEGEPLAGDLFTYHVGLGEAF